MSKGIKRTRIVKKPGVSANNAVNAVLNNTIYNYENFSSAAKALNTSVGYISYAMRIKSEAADLWQQVINHEITLKNAIDIYVERRKGNTLIKAKKEEGLICYDTFEEYLMENNGFLIWMQDKDEEFFKPQEPILEDKKLSDYGEAIRDFILLRAQQEYTRRTVDFMPAADLIQKMYVWCAEYCKFTPDIDKFEEDKHDNF